MPLHNKKPFARAPPPPNLGPADPVYFLEATGEIFQSYDDFFDRMIQLNSTHWSCTLTGKTGLTYFEALESEREAQQELENFPDFLERPILYMVQNLTCRGRLDDVLSDVMAFIKDRYFLGEEVHFLDGKRKRTARVEAVRLEPHDAGYLSPVRKTNGKVAKEHDIGLPSADSYKYDVQIVDDDDDDEEEEEDEDGDGRREGVPPAFLTRMRNLLSKQKLRLFLKNTCVLEDKRQEVKESVRRDNLLDQHTWESFFVGPEPNFASTPLLVRGRPAKNPKPPEEKKPRKSREPKAEKKEKGEGKKSRKSAVSESGSASPRKMSDKKRKQIETQQDELAPQIETAKRLGVENISRWLQWERVLTPKDIEELKEQIKQARVKEREETKERKRREKEAAAEWKKPRDDLMCDDLKPLPSYAPLPLPSWLNEDELADLLSIHHFFLSFQEILPIKEVRGTPRISLSDVVIAVRCSDPRFSTFADLMKILMIAKCERADDEDGDEANLNRQEEIGLNTADLDHVDYGDEIRTRNELHERIRETHGSSVRHLTFDWCTMSEIIRLHLLTSGYFTGVATFRHRTFQRGGPRCFEDAGFQFCERHPDVLAQLETSTVYDLEPSERLALLKMVADQLMSYQKFRQYHDDRQADLIEHKRQLRMLRNWGAAQEKDAREAELAREYEAEQAEKEGDAYHIERPKPSKETTRLRVHLKALREGRRTDRAELEQLVLAGVAYNELEHDEILEARQVQREHYEEGEQALLSTIYEIEGISCLVYLGRDRAYRSYFFLEALPALLVEESSEWDRERAGPCDEPTPISDTSFYGTEWSARIALLACTADEYCPSHGSFARERPRWSFIDHPDKLQQLIVACNSRGLRESELADELIFHQSKLEELVERTQRKSDFGQLTSFFMADNDDPALIGGEMDWDKEIREVIADLEEKMFLGQVASLPSTIDRSEWRQRLLETGDVTGMTMDDVYIRVEGELKKEEESGDTERELIWNREEIEGMCPAERYAFALLQLFHSIPLRFIKEPFVKQNRNGDTIIDEVFICWQRQIATVRSIPAVFLFLYTVEQSIEWSNSRLQGKCRACRRKGEAQSLVLCVDCLLTYHLSCVRPALSEAVPDWTCSECTAARRREAAKAKRAATKEAERKKVEDVRVKDEEYEESDYEDGCYARSNSILVNGDSSMVKEENEELKPPPMTTSSGRVVKKVFYNENVLSPALSKRRSGRETSVKRENGIYEYDSADSEDYGRRSAKRRRDEIMDPTLRSLSIGLRENTHGLKEGLVECEKAIKETMSVSCAWPFVVPVDVKEVPDYYDVIKDPMDLRTMIQKIKNKVYDSLDEVKADLELMINNCRTYNEDGSDILELAEQTGAFLMPKLEKIIKVAAGVKR